MDYLVKLDEYEGPLECLLRLVEKQEIAATSVPVCAVIRQLVECLAAVSYADVDGGGRFLVLAATLLAVKAQLLLPQPEETMDSARDREAGAPEAFDVTAEQAEYLQFKHVAKTLEEYASDWLLSYKRHPCRDPGNTAQLDTKDDITRLVTAFTEILDRTAFSPGPYRVEEAINFQEMLESVFGKIAGKKSGLPFQQLFLNAGKLEVIYNFLAVLELVFRGRVRITQKNDGQIFLAIVKQKHSYGEDHAGNIS